MEAPALPKYGMAHAEEYNPSAEALALLAVLASCYQNPMEQDGLICRPLHLLLEAPYSEAPLPEGGTGRVSGGGSGGGR